MAVELGWRKEKWGWADNREKQWKGKEWSLQGGEENGKGEMEAAC